MWGPSGFLSRLQTSDSFSHNNLNYSVLHLLQLQAIKAYSKPDAYKDRIFPHDYCFTINVIKQHYNTHKLQHKYANWWNQTPHIHESRHNTLICYYRIKHLKHPRLKREGYDWMSVSNLYIWSLSLKNINMFEWLRTNEWNAFGHVSLLPESHSRNSVSSAARYAFSSQARLYDIRVTWFDRSLRRKGYSTTLQ